MTMFVFVVFIAVLLSPLAAVVAVAAIVDTVYIAAYLLRIVLAFCKR